MIARNEVDSDDNAVRYRVGVHLGDVMIDYDDLLGDDVHVAAQINGLAKVNGIAISDDAHRQVRNRLDACSCESVAQSVKNIDRPDQEYFANGIAEDISTRLSQFCSCQVIALNKTFIFKDRNANVTDISQELNAQLIDGETNTHLRVDGYHGILGGVFELHDEGTQAIIAAIVTHSVAAKLPRATRMEGNDLGAWDC
jgi:adenylate cyclase